MRVSRRRLLIGTLAVAGGGLAIGWLRPDPRQAALPGVGSGDLAPNAWLQMMPDGRIIVYVDKVEMGQGVMTAYVTLLAEELDVPPEWIEPQPAPVHPLFQDPVQVTAESRSVASRWEPIRRTGATARAMLVRAAGARWDVDPARLGTDGRGHVTGPGGSPRLSYAELLETAARLPVPRDVPLREPEAFRYIGGDVPRPDVPAKVAGATMYGADVRLPGMAVAVVARAPALRAGAVSFDDAGARRLPGVFDVFAIHSGVAVVAQSFWHAREAARALKVDWEPGALAGQDNATLHARQAEALESRRGNRVRDDGDVDAGSNGQRLEAEYTTPWLAHATMEPMNATIRFHDAGCEAWVPSQVPDLARQTICDMTGLPRDSVTVHTPLVGGGFGRRASLDWLVEAVEIARRAGRPVKLMWTREDDMRHGLYRQATIHRLSAVLGQDGLPRSWHHRVAAEGLLGNLIPPALSTVFPGWIPGPLVSGVATGAIGLGERFLGPFQAREGAVDLPYAIPNVRVETVHAETGMPLTTWRSVGSSYNAFAVECFLDELAGMAGIDPAEYRRRLLGGRPRHLAVLDAAVERAGWGRPAAGRYQGMALHESFGAIVGQVAEVSLGDGGVPMVHRITCVVDCGLVVNPDVVRQQMEGGVIFGLSAALYGELTIEDGCIRQGNFHDYRVTGLADCPEIDVEIIAGADRPGGAGEPGTPPVAPAVANAIRAAGGGHRRELPLARA